MDELERALKSFGTLQEIMDKFDRIDDDSVAPVLCTVIDHCANRFNQTGDEYIKSLLPAIEAINKEFGKM